MSKRALEPPAAAAPTVVNYGHATINVNHNDGQGNPSKHAWTRDYHRAFVKAADGAWVKEE